MITVTSYPQKVIDNNNSKLSKWSAVNHKMIFGMQRRDFDITCASIDGDATLMSVTLSGYTGTLSNDIAIGDSIYLETLTGSGTFVVNTLVAPNRLTVIRSTFTGYGSGYCNFLNRLNYFARTIIWGVDAFGNYYYVGTSINKPDSTGRLKVDVSSFLKSTVGYINTFDYGSINKKDLSLGGTYNITYQENWKAFEGSYSAISSVDLRAYGNSAKQIQDLYGENLGEYVPFYFDSEPAGDTKAKFLSDFDKPTYFPGFPFDLSFIYPENLSGIETNRGAETFDINGNTVDATSYSKLDNSQIPNINRMLTLTSFGAGATEMDVWLESDGVADPVLVIAEGYVASGYFAEEDGVIPVGLVPVVNGVLTPLALSEIV